MIIVTHWENPQLMFKLDCTKKEFIDEMVALSGIDPDDDECDPSDDILEEWNVVEFKKIKKTTVKKLLGI